MYQFTYKHDANGNRLDGNKTVLIDAVLSGQNIKVSFDYGDWVKFYAPVGVHYNSETDHVYAEVHTDSANLQAGSQGVTFYTWAGNAVFSTSGQEYFQLWNGSAWKSARPHFPMSWFVEE